MMIKIKKIYLIGLVLLLISLATPFVIDYFNPWPSVKRMGAAILVIGFIFSSSLAVFLKEKEKTKQ